MKKITKNIICMMILGLLLTMNMPINVLATNEEGQEKTTEVATEATNTEPANDTVEMGKAYIKALYSSDIEMSADDIFVITYAVIGYTDVAKITVDASTITETTEIEMPVAEYFVDNIEYQGKNDMIKSQGFGATLKFNSAPKGGTILYISIGKEQNDYLDSTYEETYIIDEKHANGPLNDPYDGRFNNDDATTEFQYTPEDIDWDMEYDDNYGVEEQIQDGTQKPEVEHYNDIESTTQSNNEEETTQSSGGIGGIFFVLVLFAVAGIVLWKVNKK